MHAEKKRFMGPVISRHIAVWASVVAQRAAAMLSRRPGIFSAADEIDMPVYLIGLRNVVRAVEWAHRETRLPRIADGLAEFHRRVPHWKELRDAAEHFDDYELGLGRAQADKMRRTAAAQERGVDLAWWPAHFFFSADGQDMYFHLEDWSIGIRDGLEATDALADVAYEAIQGWVPGASEDGTQAP